MRNWRLAPQSYKKRSILCNLPSDEIDTSWNKHRSERDSGKLERFLLLISHRNKSKSHLDLSLHFDAFKLNTKRISLLEASLESGKKRVEVKSHIINYMKNQPEEIESDAIVEVAN